MNLDSITYQKPDLWKGSMSSLWSKHCYDSHFTDEENKAEVTYLKICDRAGAQTLAGGDH